MSLETLYVLVQIGSTVSLITPMDCTTGVDITQTGMIYTVYYILRADSRTVPYTQAYTHIYI